MPDSRSSLTCPACGAWDVRRSYPRALKDAFMRLVGRRPYRCRRCGHRFYDHAGKHAAPPPDSPVSRAS